MKPIIADPRSSVVVALDVQPSVLNLIEDAERIVDRSIFLVRMAHLAGVPIIQSEQNPSRLGATEPRLQAVIEPCQKVHKMDFGAAATEPFMSALRQTDRKTVVLFGVETHICVVQTVCGLIAAGYEVFVCLDATGARTPDRHQAGLERLKLAGAVPTHTESVAYEWLRTASNPKFREALGIVKEARF